jgi:hypothetical protein
VGRATALVAPRTSSFSKARDYDPRLAQLTEGRSLAQAARLLHLSQRTAERRLAAARKALGARTTAEALLALGREAAG